jgi:hypothetical protein
MDGDPKAYLTDNPAIHGAGNPTVDGLKRESTERAQRSLSQEDGNGKMDRTLDPSTSASDMIFGGHTKGILPLLADDHVAAAVAAPENTATPCLFCRSRPFLPSRDTSR